MKLFKSVVAATVLAGMVTFTGLTGQAFAGDGVNDYPPHHEGISGRSVVGGLLSFLIWPGIGQAVNDNRGRKVGTHAVLGLIPPYRFWSGYDALVDRNGGYWDGRI